MYAIIEDSGKQYRVTGGDVIRIDRAETPEPGSTLTFDRVLLVAGEAAPRVGAPVVAGATVTASVIGAKLGDKVRMQKYRRRKGYSRKQGHRQPFVEVRITAINA